MTKAMFEKQKQKQAPRHFVFEVQINEGQPRLLATISTRTPIKAETSDAGSRDNAIFPSQLRFALEPACRSCCEIPNSTLHGRLALGEVHRPVSFYSRKPT